MALLQGAPNTYDMFGAFTVTNSETTFAMGSLTTTQVGELIIQNLGTVDVFVGPKGNVTTSNGIKIPAANGTGTTQMGGMLTLQAGFEIGAITSGGSADVRILRTKYT